MDNPKTYCSCGAEHDFDNGTLKKFNLRAAPEYIECSECPECNPELLDTIENHEDEAYSEKVNIDDLNKNLSESMDFDDAEDIGTEEY